VFRVVVGKPQPTQLPETEPTRSIEPADAAARALDHALRRDRYLVQDRGVDRDFGR
jgi:hypothetical protein